eukprot:jgi/Galph1/5678/GphlegSOOS_G4379.1
MQVKAVRDLDDKQVSEAVSSDKRTDEFEEKVNDQHPEQADGLEKDNKTIYVYPISERVREEHLREIFTLFGAIKVLLQREQRYACVLFENEHEAATTSKIMDGGVLDGKNISVTFHRDFERYLSRLSKRRPTKPVGMFRHSRIHSPVESRRKANYRSNFRGSTRLLKSDFREETSRSRTNSNIPNRGRFEQEKFHVGNGRDSSSEHSRRIRKRRESSRHRRKHRHSPHDESDSSSFHRGISKERRSKRRRSLSRK